ncbi:MAG: hypothetical protein ACRDHV_04630 [Actinomycetota bacterium]
MSKHRFAWPSLARIVAMVALLAVLASTATALPGKNSVDKNDLAKNVVKSKNIKQNAVRAKHVKDGQLTEADLVGEEQLHIVGAPGEPAFNNGGQGDCTWMSAGNEIPTLMPVGFRMDRFGMVHLSGIAFAEENPGAGDEECGATSPEPDDSAEDLVAFTLPPEYRSEKSTAFVTGDSTILIIGVEPLNTGIVTLAPGSVFVTDPFFGAALDMVSFPAASADVVAKVAPRSGSARVGGSLPGILRELGL